MSPVQIGEITKVDSQLQTYRYYFTYLKTVIMKKPDLFDITMMIFILSITITGCIIALITLT